MFAKRQFLTTIFVLVILLCVANYFPHCINSLYIKGIYPVISTLNQSLWASIPFSIGDIGYTIAFLLIINKLIRFSFKRQFWKALSVFSFTVLIFYSSWGLLYFKTPIREERKLPNTLTVSALTETTIYYANQLREQHLALSKSSQEPIQIDLDVPALLALATKTMESSSLRPNKIHGKAKATLFPTLLSYMGFGGYANPFTHEAQVNTLQPKLNILTTACHEIAHQWGYAHEDEANYIGVKASIHATNPLVVYAGNLLAFRYLINSLYAANTDQYQKIIETLPKGVIAHIKESQSFWKQYQNPFEKVFEKSYDQYLRINKQKEGINSYSLVVGLLVDDASKL